MWIRGQQGPGGAGEACGSSVHLEVQSLWSSEDPFSSPLSCRWQKGWEWQPGLVIWLELVASPL